MNGRRLLLHQIGLEQRSFWRNPETAFFSFFLPVGLLLIFGAISSGDKIPGRPDLKALTFFVPGILAFGIINQPPNPSIRPAPQATARLKRSLRPRIFAP